MGSRWTPKFRQEQAAKRQRLRETDPATFLQINAIAAHPNWCDGREGYLWCRFDARLTEDARHLFAELTWDDNQEDDGIDQTELLTYFWPELLIQTNSDTEDGLQEFDYFAIDLTQAEAAAILREDPLTLLTTYAEQISKLKIAPQEKTSEAA